MSTLHDLPVGLDHDDAATQPPTRLALLPAADPGFDAAVRAVTPRLQRYVLRRLGDRHEAEELVQEALLRAYQHADQLRTEDDLAAWTTVVAGRLVIDRLRVRGRSTSVAEVPEGLRTSRDTADVVVARDEARTALDALDAMPARQAAVLWAREVEGLGYDAIGERYGMTEPAVRSLLSRARKALRREFAVRGGTLPAGGLALLAPWADSLTWLDRLRRLAGRTVTPAAVAVLGAGVLGGALVAPWAVPSLEPGRSAVVQSDVGAPPSPAAATPGATVQAPAPTAVDLPRPAPVAPAPGAPAPGQRDVLDRLDDTCAGAAGVTAGGSCAPGAGGDEVVLLPLVPEPVDLPGDGGVGVELPAPVCRTLPAVPAPAPAAVPTLVRCTPEETP